MINYRPWPAPDLSPNWYYSDHWLTLITVNFLVKLKNIFPPINRLPIVKHFELMNSLQPGCYFKWTLPRDYPIWVPEWNIGKIIKRTHRAITIQWIVSYVFDEPNGPDGQKLRPIDLIVERSIGSRYYESIELLEESEVIELLLTI